MKALVVTPYYYPRIGGLENYARQLNHALMEQEQWEVVVVTSTESRRSLRETTDGYLVYRLGTWFKLSNTPFNPLWPLMIRAIIKREQPDVIVAHAPVPSMADAAVAAKGKTPMILVYHAATLLKAGSPLFNSAARVYSLLSAGTFRRVDKIFAVSEFVRQRFAPSLRTKTTVVPNAVWAREITPRIQPATPEFIFIASLDRSHAWKGLELVLRAVAIYRERYDSTLHLTVVGDGNMRTDYERMADTLGIRANVQFTGAQVGEQKVQTLRRAMGMIIYPVTENDAFPTVLLEAWANYVPVIGSRIGAVASLMRHGKDGLLCDALDPSGLADTLHDFVKMSRAARGRLARAAAARTAHDYTWERQARRVNREARKLL